MARNLSLLGVGMWSASFLPYSDPWLAPRAKPMWQALQDYRFFGSASTAPTQSPSPSSSPATPSPIPTSTNGRCGLAYGFCPNAECCSEFGYCGVSDVSLCNATSHPALEYNYNLCLALALALQTFCGVFCQSKFGVCRPSNSPAPSCVPTVNATANITCGASASRAPMTGSGVVSSSSSSSSGPSSSELAGVAVGAVVLGIAALLLLYCCLCYKPKKKEEK